MNIDGIVYISYIFKKCIRNHWLLIACFCMLADLNTVQDIKISSENLQETHLVSTFRFPFCKIVFHWCLEERTDMFQIYFMIFFLPPWFLMQICISYFPFSLIVVQEFIIVKFFKCLYFNLFYLLQLLSLYRHCCLKETEALKRSVYLTSFHKEVSICAVYHH